MLPPPSITLHAENGAVSIEGCELRLTPGLSREAVLAALSDFYRRSIDHHNGYEWLFFNGLMFAGQACGLSICFHHGHLREIHWGVVLPGAKMESGWPTREAIEQEVAFVRAALSKIFSRSFSSGHEQFTWGQVWSVFDPKGFLASSGLRYAA